MSVYRTSFVYCDSDEDCESHSHAFPGVLDGLDQIYSVADLRADMRAAGWRTVNGLDFCPNCVEAGVHRANPRTALADTET